MCVLVPYLNVAIKSSFCVVSLPVKINVDIATPAKAALEIASESAGDESFQGFRVVSSCLYASISRVCVGNANNCVRDDPLHRV